jgi:hypothetical protein
LFDTSQNDTGLVVEALFGFGKFLAEMGDTVTPKILQGVGRLLSRLLAGAVMFGWLLMIIGYIDGVRHWWVDRVASVVNSAWRSTNSPNHYQTQNLRK